MHLVELIYEINELQFSQSVIGCYITIGVEKWLCIQTIVNCLSERCIRYIRCILMYLFLTVRILKCTKMYRVTSV